MTIAFCINRLGLIGLGVTLSSLIRNCSDAGKLKLWFFCANFTNKEKSHIRRLLASERFCGMHHFIDFDPVATFGSFCSLHGDWTAYGRLLLADFIKEDQVLYLDSDLVVEADVLQVAEYDFAGKFLAAVGGGKFKYTLGNRFYIQRLKLDPDLDYFNSGVLLLNLRQWRELDIKQQCLEIARQYPTELPSHDQSLLNILCAGNFAKLPRSFNCEWRAESAKPDTSEKMIIHFAGSPKPWDPFGFLFHNGYHTWAKYQDRDWAAAFGKLTSAEFHRAWTIRRSYIRSIRNRILN